MSRGGSLDRFGKTLLATGAVFAVSRAIIGRPQSSGIKIAPKVFADRLKLMD